MFETVQDLTKARASQFFRMKAALECREDRLARGIWLSLTAPQLVVEIIYYYPPMGTSRRSRAMSQMASALPNPRLAERMSS